LILSLDDPDLLLVHTRFLFMVVVQRPPLLKHAWLDSQPRILGLAHFGGADVLLSDQILVHLLQIEI
jgi:hypothetical protein